MLKHFFGLLLIVSVLSSCSDSRYKILVDNPTTKKISVTIDKEVVELDSLQSKMIYVEHGDHIMKFKDSTFHFDVPADKGNSDIKLLINPTRSGYILRQLSYVKHPPVTKDDFEKEQLLKLDPSRNIIPYDTIDLLDVVIVAGNYKKTTVQFIVDTYDYGIDTEIPEENKVNQYQNRAQFVKMYREKDFLKAFMDKHKKD